MGEDELKVGMMIKRSQQKKSFGPVNYKERVFVLTRAKLSYYDGTEQVRYEPKSNNYFLYFCNYCRHLVSISEKSLQLSL